MAPCWFCISNDLADYSTRKQGRNLTDAEKVFLFAFPHREARAGTSSSASWPLLVKQIKSTSVKHFGNQLLLYIFKKGPGTPVENISSSLPVVLEIIP